MARNAKHSVKCVVCSKEYTLVSHRVRSNLEANNGKITCRGCMAKSKTGNTTLIDSERVYNASDIKGLPVSSKLKVQIRCSKCGSCKSITAANAKENASKNGEFLCRNCVLAKEEVRKKQSATRLKISVDEWTKFYSAQHDYDTQWTAPLRKAIRKRDESCLLCGSRGQKRALTVHHVDWNKKNSTPNNLIALCCVCHNKVHNANVRSIEELMIYADLTRDCKN